MSTSNLPSRPGFSTSNGHQGPQTQHFEAAWGTRSQVEAHGRGTSNNGNTLLPSVAVPSGGGAIKGMNEAFAVDVATGTLSLKVPVPITPCPRWGTPELTLEYNSGGGNGIWGLGWELRGVPAIERKTTNGLPRYIDDEDDFLLAGEQLVPVLKKSPSGGWLQKADGTYEVDEHSSGDYLVQLYRPRLDQSYERIERWTRISDHTDVYWRVLSSANETQIFGRSEESRISAGKRIFHWLLCEAYDSHGGAQVVEWKMEDSANIDVSSRHERNRTEASRASNRFLKRIKYGNATPNRSADWTTTLSPNELSWLFEVVFDYGDHDHSHPQPDDDAKKEWLPRKDPFSSYISGFEVRTYRICRRILMYHNFPGALGQPSTLVSSLDLQYHEDSTASFLMSACQVGYSKDINGKTVIKRLPLLEFEYTQPPSGEKLQDMSIQKFRSEQLGALPVDGSGEIQWIDLAGDGTTGILGQGDEAWYYKRNLSMVVLDPTPPDSDAEDENDGTRIKLDNIAEVPWRPNFASGAEVNTSLVDLNGDGVIDFMVNGGGIHGYYRGRHENEDGSSKWQSFEPFAQWPNIDFQDPNLRMIDVTGNGCADILITTDHLVVWHPSCGFQGFGPAQSGSTFIDEEKGPRIVLSDPTQSIFLADMSGDGLVDIVRIRNSDICYWPNLGYGRFGDKISMDNSPLLGRDSDFNYRQLLLCDVDGSGTNDLLYFHSSGATLFYNETGNSWSDGFLLPGVVPSFNSQTQVAAVDLLGTGTACLVWSSTAPAAVREIGFVDLMNATKPHLLKKWKDNRGSEVTITYRSSTAYYLQDEQEGNPWATRIPFPVHCVDTVLDSDLINRRVFSHRYRYHHGHYDGLEREFCGFGMVEEWDTEEFDIHAKMSLEKLDDGDRALHSPPVHTKTWFHVGAFDDLQAMRSLYGKGFHALSDVDIGPKDHFLSDFKGLDYSGAELKEATRVLKGRKLHGESYDASQEDKIPFEMEDNGYSVRMLQPRGQNKHAVFQCFDNEVYTTHYEHDAADPMITHDLTLKVDHFGNVLQSVHVAYGRREQTDSLLRAEEQLFQQQHRIVFTETTFTNAISTEVDHLMPHPSSERKYELSGLLLTASGRFTYHDFAGSGDFHPLDSLQIIEYHDLPPGTPCKRLVASHRSIYQSDNLQQLLPHGTIESLALPGREYRLCLTAAMTSLFGHHVKAAVPTREAFLKAGYEDLDNDGSFWIPSPTISYVGGNLSQNIRDDELSEARALFFRPRRMIDPFGASTTTSYDAYTLLAETTTDAVGNISTAMNDYRVMAPHTVIECNQNKTQFAWDALGRLVGIANVGKSQIESFYNDPLGGKRKILAKLSLCYIIDDDAFWRSGSPTAVTTIEALQHGNYDSRDIKLHIDYHDSHDHCVQRASPSTKNLWLTSGWVVFNNKGLQVQEFDPSFSDSHHFRYNARSGHSAFTFYDVRERPIGTLYPDHTWTKTVYGNWQTTQYDRNDLVAQDPSQDPLIGSVVKLLPQDSYHPTWYECRREGQLGVVEKAAADKALKHQNTPTRTFCDSLGNDFLHGYAISIVDALDRKVTQSSYDMEGRALLLESMDHSSNTTFYDINGSIVCEWREDNTRIRTEHDALRRPTDIFVKEGESAEACVLRTVYGDRPDLVDAEQHNLRGRVLKQYDQSGVRVQKQYDEKGDCVLSEQRLTTNYRDTIDWNGEVDLQPRVYESSATFDAVGRIASRTAADGTIYMHEYDANGLLFAIKVKFLGEDWKYHISKVEYDEQLREILCAQDINGTKTVTEYDELSHRVTRKTIKRGGKALQDVEFTYDANSNLVRQHDHAIQDVYFHNGVVPPTSEYTYDAAYRLVEASGREHLGQTKGRAPGPGSNDFTPGTGNAIHAEDATTVARYTETSTYDEAGNILQLKHIIHDQKTPSWSRTYSYQSPSLLEPGKFNNRLTSTAIGGKPDGRAFEYDEHGHILSMPGLTHTTWNYHDQLRSSSSQIKKEGHPDTVWYVYDIFGKRTRKISERQVADGRMVKTSECVYLDEIEEVTEFDGQGEISLRCDTVRVQAGGSSVAIVERWSGRKQEEKGLPSLLIRFQFKHLLDSIMLELDEEGNIISYEEYTPYGSTAYRAGLKRAPKRYRYAGKERDRETGLYYSEQRYYISWLCRWLSGDPIGTAGGVNIYEYAASNPIEFHDPHGTAPKTRSQGETGQNDNKTSTSTKAKLKTPMKPDKDKQKANTTAAGGGRVANARKNKSHGHRGRKRREVVDSRVRATINRLEMTRRENLDGMWDEWFESKASHVEGEEITNLEAMVAENGPEGDRINARNTMLHMLQKHVVDSGYMSWDEVLDHRCTFKDPSIREVQAEVKRTMIEAIGEDGSILLGHNMASSSEKQPAGRFYIRVWIIDSGGIILQLVFRLKIIILTLGSDITVLESVLRVTR
ncbi:Toxin subunit YenB-like protein [Cladobotryum mycophilum]|uniref:Toxin subunit YenB-like protein n=1 Tax=Cladobotryum mycophilum TaxID=491253 RepID=A0ABR0SV68_9HYPO